MLDVINRN